MKNQLIKFLLFFLFISCTTNTKSSDNRIHAEYTTYEEYSGKTVKSINYYKNTNPYMMVIEFTDGSVLYVCANKYCLDVIKK